MDIMPLFLHQSFRTARCDPKRLSGGFSCHFGDVYLHEGCFPSVMNRNSLFRDMPSLLITQTSVLKETLIFGCHQTLCVGSSAWQKGDQKMNWKTVATRFWENCEASRNSQCRLYNYALSTCMNTDRRTHAVAPMSPARYCGHHFVSTLICLGPAPDKEIWARLSVPCSMAFPR